MKHLRRIREGLRDHPGIPTWFALAGMFALAIAPQAWTLFEMAFAWFCVMVVPTAMVLQSSWEKGRDEERRKAKEADTK